MTLGGVWQAASEPTAVSGRLENGYRILTIPTGATPLAFTVYRGDYVKFEIPADSGDSLLVIPELKVEQRLPHRLAEARHITMRQAGVVPFTLNNRPGTITVVDFKRPNYRELTAAEAADLIERFEPLILDVRTPREYQSGHLPDAFLLPVQELQANINRLASYREREILIYCATGNRSTVAAKILLDGGFKQITNLRHGLVDWQRRDLPVVR
jgi:rhodanese-related sulfurtransferase